ncbi:MAG: fluoride efflux transporter CrcB [Gemmatimonadota bacterium]
MLMLLWVGLGSALGGMARFLLGGWMQRASPGFPWMTMLINVSGSFLLGMIMRNSGGASMRPETRAFFAIGICGGYTTFSTFSYETMMLLRDGQWWRAASYALASVVLSLLAVFAGFAVTRPVA